MNKKIFILGFLIFTSKIYAIENRELAMSMALENFYEESVTEYNPEKLKIISEYISDILVEARTLDEQKLLEQMIIQALTHNLFNNDPNNKNFQLITAYVDFLLPQLKYTKETARNWYYGKIIVGSVCAVTAIALIIYEVIYYIGVKSIAAFFTGTVEIVKGIFESVFKLNPNELIILDIPIVAGTIGAISAFIWTLWSQDKLVAKIDIESLQAAIKSVKDRLAIYEDDVKDFIEASATLQKSP